MGKFIKKADEMEMTINFKAMRLSWVFLTLSLAVWDIYILIKGETSNLVTLLIAVNLIIFSGSKLYYAKKMTTYDKK
ncbi:MAG: hypothetical protein PHN72_05805 [Bacilli bacterium]|nr:hypothetical protein [Bacilli bacterium]